MTTYTTKGYMRIEDDGYWISVDGEPITDDYIRKHWQDEIERLQGRLRYAEKQLAKFNAKQEQPDSEAS